MKGMVGMLGGSAYNLARGFKWIHVRFWEGDRLEFLDLCVMNAKFIKFGFRRGFRINGS